MRFKGYSGPVGSGKSKALCYEAIRLSYLNAGRVGLLGAPTYRMLKDSTLKSVLETLSDQHIPHTFRRAEQTITFPDNGSTILLRSLTNSEYLRGTNLSWFGIDELTYTNETSWMQLEARLRDPKAKHYCGFGVWTPKGPDWVHRRFINGSNPNYQAIMAKPFENNYVLDKNPIYYDLLENSYCESEYRQEVLGEYVTGDHNKVYGSFDPLLHLRNTTRKPHLPILWAFDFNVDPMCSLVAQKDCEHLTILDELVLRRSGTAEMCSEFANRYGDHPGPIRIYGDASGNARSTKGTSDYDIIRRTLRNSSINSFMVVVPTKNPPVRDRVSLVNSLLKAAAGTVRLTLDMKCKELIKDLQELRFKEGSSIVDKASDPNRSHLSDALGYLSWQEYSNAKAHGDQNRRLL